MSCCSSGGGDDDCCGFCCCWLSSLQIVIWFTHIGSSGFSCKLFLLTTDRNTDDKLFSTRKKRWDKTETERRVRMWKLFVFFRCCRYTKTICIMIVILLGVCSLFFPHSVKESQSKTRKIVFYFQHSHHHTECFINFIFCHSMCLWNCFSFIELAWWYVVLRILDELFQFHFNWKYQ